MDVLSNPEDTFTSTIIDTLISIAEQCRMDGGDGVSTARALLRNRLPEEPFVEGDCQSSYGIITKYKENYKSNKFYVFPNPTSSSINIEIPNIKSNTEFTLRIISLDQHILFEQKFRVSKIKVNPDLPQGIYFIQVFNEAHLLDTRKVVIVN